MNIPCLARRCFPILHEGSEFTGKKPVYELLVALPAQVGLYTSMDVAIEMESNHG